MWIRQGLHVAICGLEFADPSGTGPQRRWIPTGNRNDEMTILVNYGVVIEEQKCGTIEFGVTVSAFSRNACQVGAKRLINKSGGQDMTPPPATLSVRVPGRQCVARPLQYDSASPGLTPSNCPSLRTVVECPIPCNTEDKCATALDSDVVLLWKIGNAVSPRGFLVRASYFVPKPDETKVKCCKITECEIKMITRGQQVQ